MFDSITFLKIISSEKGMKKFIKAVNKKVKDSNKNQNKKLKKESDKNV